MADVTFSVTNESTEVNMEVETLILGHGEEITGLASVGDHFLTCSLDKSLIMWDITAKKAKWVETVRSPLTCVALSPDGSKFAAGSQDGHLYFTDVEERSLTRMKFCADPIISLAFSPDGQRLAFGAKDDTIYYIENVDNLPENQEHVHLNGHSSHVKHLDFASDNLHLRSNSADLELLFWNAQDQETDSEVIDSLQGWASQNCTLSFETLGLWHALADGTDINCSAKAEEKGLVAAGDDFGRVRIYRFPANHVNAECKELIGHADHVKNVAFSGDGQILSSGGLEMSLFQWS